MGEECSAKVFRSGNSVALRLPKALGLKEGDVMRLRLEANGFALERLDQPKRKFDVAKVWGIGKGLGLRLIRPEDRIFDERPSEIAKRAELAEEAADPAA
jgi:antitoxin VapB